jgi:FKBP-type peptidyl-prolyl cis-trans isomerase SlyD
MKNAMIVDGKQVTLLVKMYDSQGELVGAPEQPMVYVHGSDQIFKKLEEVLAGKTVGESVSAYLQPEEHFGDYDAELVRVEERDKFPSELEVGMQFEAESDDVEEEPMVVTVTDVTDEGVVLDGNHPLAGMALRFDMVVQEIGEPDPEALDEVVDEEDNTEFREVRRTLH